MKVKRIYSKMDKFLLILTTFLFMVGCLFILSASSVSAVVKSQVSPYYYFFRQILLLVVSYAFGFIVILKFPTKYYKKIVYMILAGIGVILVSLLLYGTVTNNAKSWFSLFSIPFQPSEFLKVALIVYLGVFYNDLDKKKHGKYSFLIPVIVAAIFFFLIAAQPDFGTAFIIAAICFLTFLSIPIKDNKSASNIKMIGLILPAILISILLFGKNLFTDTQLSRFQFQNPCTRYTEATGYQVCNGFIAMHNGGLLGVGIGNSTQKYLYLPEAHTDFIFAILVEEAGFIISSIVILLLLTVIFRIFKIAKECLVLRNSIICYGIAMYILIHLLINFMGILALIPLTGVPVPFLSYGGSYGISLSIALFIIQRINIENKILKKNLEIKSIVKEN